MRHALSIALVCALGGCARGPEARQEAVIFGADDRIEVHEVSSDALRDAVVRAVPAMVLASRLRVEADGSVSLASRPLGPSHDLCEGEAHFDQPSLASCSGTLIDDDLVLTAGHCVEGMACSNLRFVFGWYYEAPGVLTTVEQGDVYSCAEIAAFEYSGSNDFAIVRLDRPAPGPPIEVRLEPIAVNEGVSLAGYPLGIPMKVVEAGTVTGTISRSRFYARLDAHPGNSGSGVLDDSLRVVGELTNGPIDAFVVDGDCRRLRVIGEDTWRTETINSVIPAIEALCASGHESVRLCPPRDAGVVAADASVTRPDAAAARPDASAPDAGTDAAVAPPAIRLATHCGCATETKRAPGGPGALLLLLVIAALRTRKRSGSVAST